MKKMAAIVLVVFNVSAAGAEVIDLGDSFKNDLMSAKWNTRDATETKAEVDWEFQTPYTIFDVRQQFQADEEDPTRWVSTFLFAGIDTPAKSVHSDVRWQITDRENDGKIKQTSVLWHYFHSWEERHYQGARQTLELWEGKVESIGFTLSTHRQGENTVFIGVLTGKGVFGANSNHDAWLEPVSLPHPVPEPASAALMAVGLLLTLGRGRRS